MNAPHIPSLRDIDRHQRALNEQAKLTKEYADRLRNQPVSKPTPEPMPISLDSPDTVTFNVEVEQRMVLWEAYEKGRREQAKRRNLNMPPRGYSHPLLAPRAVTEHEAAPAPAPKTYYGLTAEGWCISIAVVVLAVIAGFALANFLGSHS